METRVRKTVRIRTLQAGILLLLASTANSTGLIDRMHSLAEQAWEDNYIPDSGLPTIPLTEYDNFEVTELFRAETIEELEAAITDGYPMAWLEETLKDETIPWEDRYWLDRRVRAAIAQNTHTFFNPAGTPIHIDADAVFPGEYYWQEHMIVDPEGYNIQIREDEEGNRLPDEERPVLPRVNSVDIGLLYNLFGRKEGDLALSFNGMSLSRDGSIGLYVTGQTTEWPSSSDQYYACLLYPDGSFKEIPLAKTERQYSGTISGDGSTLVFFPESRGNSAIEVMDREGNLTNTISANITFGNMSQPRITCDGRYASCWYRTELGDIHSAVVDITNGIVRFTTEHTGTDAYSIECNFSADGKYFTIGGKCEARVVSLRDDSERSYPETARRREEGNDYTTVRCSNSGTVVALFTNRSSRNSEFFYELRVVVLDSEVYYETIESSLSYGYGLSSPDVSPNGYFVFLNNAPNWLGVRLCESPLVGYQISGRRP